MTKPNLDTAFAKLRDRIAEEYNEDKSSLYDAHFNAGMDACFPMMKRLVKLLENIDEGNLAFEKVAVKQALAEFYEWLEREK